MTKVRTAADPLERALSAVAEAGFVAPPSASERVALALSEQIVEGRLRAGTRLTEETIAVALGVSRNTVREAFALLVSERIVAREPNRGVFVASPTAEDIRDLYATRRLIEPAAVLWGRAFTTEAVAEIRAAVSRGQLARAQDRWDDVASANQQFHRALAALGGSKRVGVQMSGVLAEMRLVFHLMGEVPRFHADYLDVNDEICALLENGDRAAAANRLQEYLDQAEAQLLEALGA